MANAYFNRYREQKRAEIESQIDALERKRKDVEGWYAHVVDQIDHELENLMAERSDVERTTESDWVADL
jgi:hypothetical protein